MYCYADVNTDDPAGAAAGWRGAFADFAEPVPSLLEQGGDAYFAQIEEVVPPAWTAPGSPSSATPPMRPRPTWRRVRRWPWRTPSSSPICSRPGGPSRRPRARTSGGRHERVAWVQAQTHRRDRTRGLPPPLVKLVLRLAGERIFRSNYDPLREAP